jgi:hypothetical protein
VGGNFGVLCHIDVYTNFLFGLHLTLKMGWYILPKRQVDSANYAALCLNIGVSDVWLFSAHNHSLQLPETVHNIRVNTISAFRNQWFASAARYSIVPEENRGWKWLVIRSSTWIRPGYSCVNEVIMLCQTVHCRLTHCRIEDIVLCFPNAFDLVPHCRIGCLLTLRPPRVDCRAVDA